jgi:hypothetical protein
LEGVVVGKGGGFGCAIAFVNWGELAGELFGGGGYFLGDNDRRWDVLQGLLVGGSKGGISLGGGGQRGRSTTEGLE